MASHESIEKQLKTQQAIEGNTPETALLLKVLPLCKWGSEWQAMAKVKFHGSHRFYYPSTLLQELQKLFGPEEWQGVGFEKE